MRVFFFQALIAIVVTSLGKKEPTIDFSYQVVELK